MSVQQQKPIVTEPLKKITFFLGFPKLILINFHRLDRQNVWIWGRGESKTKPTQGDPTSERWVWGQIYPGG